MSSEEITPGTRTDQPLTGTYRVQLRPEFGFVQLADKVPYLARLGVSHVYLSPILQAVPGSSHGYDVVDHTRLSEDLGGPAGFAHLQEALTEHGLSAIADVVPNHVAVPTPLTLNAPLWSVLRDGPSSPYARWFDVDWSTEDRAILMPVLGSRIGAVLAAGELSVDRDGEEPVLRYFEHVFPVRQGTEHLPLERLVDRQWYRLAYWRVGDEELNYRRFFDIDTLAGLRVEDEEVFAETHALLVQLVRAGSLGGLRIDHPDGLADPREYLRTLERATGGIWVVVEKVLEGAEQLPPDWPCAGTTGYDALLRVGGLLIDPAGAEPLTTLYTELTGQPADFDTVVEQAKRDIVEHGLYAEVARLVDLIGVIRHGDIALRDHTLRAIREVLVELLVAFPVYRAYVVPGEAPAPVSVETVERAVVAARTRLPEERHETLDMVRDLVLGRLGRDRYRDEVVVRFQQTCGPVMAKGVEDTAFYRWWRLSSLNEVGGDPTHFGVSVEDFHSWSARMQASWPLAMTTLSTHDTKRSEDVRARLAVLSELPAEWAQAVTSWRAAAAAHRSSEGWPEPNTDYLLWQTLVGAWPMDAGRLTAYLEKATHEAKQQTSWTSPGEAYDRGVRHFAERVLADDMLRSGVHSFVERLAPYARVNVLTQKLLQLTMPGVPDVYQGTEVESLALVDPDNRRSVDYSALARLLAALEDGTVAPGLDAEKLLVTASALRLRRRHPECFGGGSNYEPMTVTSQHAIAFDRGSTALTVATRLPVGLERTGGWAGATVRLPAGRWRDELTGKPWSGGETPLGEVLGQLPVALLSRQD